MNLLVPLILVAGIALVSGCTQDGAQNGAQVLAPPEPPAGGEGPAPATWTVAATAEGFSPQEFTIRQGDTVSWENQDNQPRWPASAMHPTHTLYPGSGIEKCGTPEEDGIFDACSGIPPGGEWEFTFTEAGSWAYHDHLVTGKFGRIVVE
ncbi:MAG: hypothetical protein HY520_01415 [Candidatus Aenigmarchaeota archaeon]|nr:hypothetical protein [Candidatus Aenigmarchaeota archaeon]